MALKIEIKRNEDRYGNVLVVTHAGQVLAEEYDRGEPEDNSFQRDYAWIAPLLEKVYELGKEDGHEEGYSEGYDRGREDGYDESL